MVTAGPAPASTIASESAGGRPARLMPIREKTHRLDRELYRGTVSVSFTLCIQDSKPAFNEASLVKIFIEMLTGLTEKSSCTIPVYCFMPDHLHLIVRGTSDSSDVWKTVVAYKQKTGFWLSSKKPEIKWQKDFYDHLIRTDEKLTVHVKYILDNPVRKRLTTGWQEYPYKGAIGYTLDDVLNGIM
jgi:putative transposase